ncbi:GTP cyclohydrolase FolE2 [Pseudomonas sp. 10B1]|uniref:GTP cyclohydrolase FolE2 n=1 Tax=unclassified Pseudomonas TaxID=196821 RepID=UPI002AB48C51|nr:MULTISPECIES: GTP cyclohydrolase FolE2 [unclassified Pseudomonas]MDY7562628.1 GTP cyclohydrolase FolE2 [Pseudomonas sp. AB6]MEA9995828.1 GTP cyclohydrolase FolE2 [Pseudomonas sp. AA4]MEB0087436.1 GTP cyclohydrolase FolE2 [Pseudomonas sp. RTI1]MEB0127822.1 GTP cyclohydrolase FolE2 [Pseudomonas sp. CCC1.2]MEB0154202.1 GTP cyclohydrolase FolE2 [Pseudomonas sp. CCC4.3]
MNALTMPDIAAQALDQAFPLDWVGMCGIALPIKLKGQRLSAKADAGVSLDAHQTRGIHMSRLYLALDTLENEELTPALLHRLLMHFLHSHKGLSNSAFIRIRTELLIQRPALISALSGWKSYPFEICARIENHVFHVELEFEISYSSTCPCSAALARQLIQQQFVADFSDKPLDHAELLSWLGTSQGIVATPHSQRSSALMRVNLEPSTSEFALGELIDRVEAALGTAVQTAVKRVDEQAFALANGQNLMFCEDAARRLTLALKKAPAVTAFNLKVSHAESLHAHDAVAKSSWQRNTA